MPETEEAVKERADEPVNLGVIMNWPLELLPVGSQFEKVDEPMLSSTAPAAFSVTHYRVTGHSQAARFPGDTVGTTVFGIEALDRKLYPVKFWRFAAGGLVPEMPAELAAAIRGGKSD